MKITIPIRILILSFFTCSVCSAQQQHHTANSGTHEFFANAKALPCDAFGRVENNDDEVIIDPDPAIRFNIEYVSDNGYVIYIYQKTDNEKNSSGATVLTSKASEFNQKYNSTDGALNSSKKKYFLLSFDEYERSAYKLLKKSSFVVGAATSIIKIRPGIKSTYDRDFPVYFDYGNDFSLGVLFGWKFNSTNPTKKSAFNALFGFGTVALPTDSLRTKGFLTSPATNQGLYGSFGLVMDYQNFQFGVFTGVDWMTGEAGRHWIYRDRPWFGISIGYSIFKTKKPNGEDSN